MAVVDDELSLVFAALADPTRREMLARLAEGEASVVELGTPFAMTQQAVSKHLKVLERAGLVSRSRQAQFRPCRLETQPLEGAADWIEQNRKVWEGRIDRLDEHLARILNTTRKGPKP